MLSSATSTMSLSTGRKCCIASVSHKAVYQSVRCLTLSSSLSVRGLDGFNGGRYQVVGDVGARDPLADEHFTLVLEFHTMHYSYTSIGEVSSCQGAQDNG